jgi:peptidoglycan hydrolase-like protein with peptidoglycan-binding domain
VLAPLGAAAADEFTSLHPEAAYPDNAPPLASPGPYSEFTKQVQEKLHELGFDAGPANGDFGSKTQAALAQFQLSRDLPASGQLDQRTVDELGVQRDS